MPKIRNWGKEDPTKAFKEEWPVEQDKDQNRVAPWDRKKGIESRERSNHLCQILLKM